MKIPKPFKLSFFKEQRKCDVTFGKLVRAKAGNICQLHAIAREKRIQLPFCCGGQMVCFHIIPKGQSRNALRYDFKNVICACSGGNTWESYNRNTWMQLAPELFPEDWIYLQTWKRATCKRTAFDLSLLRKVFEQSLKEK